ncbi:Plastid lipid-associated protein/fibrillin conserved domain [Macleaya cordata]|uniref:Plastid lipid-associated protein/fibrillin conserved domain n=1 Tax=Macleaya cordata TaxID=56857 RepID=A0A200PVV6_MACCD|nr:Plastid lipid-associated protein/fibrillin conserved domain [Macleaya cordata]
MATSLLQSSVVLSYSYSSSSSSSSLTHLFPKNIPTNRSTSNLKSLKLVSTASLQRFNHSKRNIIRRSTDNETAVLDSPLLPPPTSEIKLKLLSIVSGLNRGLAANEEDLEKADAAAKELEAVGGLVDLSEDLDKLQGRWKLIYSSAFSSRTLGGSRPGPPTGRLLPITLGQVFQRIDIFSKDFDNIVELQLGAPWPLPPIEVTATLAHKFELTGSAKVKIIFEKTSVKTTGNLSQLPLLELPRIPDALRPPSNTGSGEFEVTYIDADTRITRGDRGELRVFVIS